MYYLRSNAKAQARQSLGVDTAVVEKDVNTVEVALPVEVQSIKIPDVIEKEVQVNLSADVSSAESEALQGLNCSLDNPDDCLMCGS